MVMMILKRVKHATTLLACGGAIIGASGKSMYTRAPLQSHISLAQSLWKGVIEEGDLVVDCTCGTGKDTEFLADCVGNQGRVYALDINEDALRRTKNRIENEIPDEVFQRIRFIDQSHELPPLSTNSEQYRLIVFNLGYLPGEVDKKTITTAESTLNALVRWCLPSIVPGGSVSITVYPGHVQGQRESLALQDFARNLSPSTWRATQHQPVNHKPSAPYLLSLHRLFRPPKASPPSEASHISMPPELSGKYDVMENFDRPYNAALDALRLFDDQHI